MLICNAVLTDADGARPGDVRIENGVITAVGEGLSTGGDTVLDAGGRTLLPAFIDLHCHFRMPGFEYKEEDVYKRQVHAIACRAAELEPCVVFPTYWFGQGHEASCFAGSVNFPPRLLYEMLEVLLDQIARNGFKKIVIFSGHGGNSHFLDYFAMTQLDREVDYTLYILRGAGKRQLALADMWETKYGHAGEEETSQIMAITPEGVVKLEQQVYELSLIHI